MNTYRYVVFDAGDGSAGTLFFKTEELFNLYITLNDESNSNEYILDDGRIDVEGTLAPRMFISEEDIRERFAEWED